MKRKFSLFLIALTVLMLMMVFPVRAKAAELIPGTGIEWGIENGTLSLTYTGSGSSVIPDYSGDPHNQPWFNESFEKIVIGSGITAIGVNSFHGCAYSSVVFEEPCTLTEIKYQAFASIDPSKQPVSWDFIIPEGVTTMGTTALGGNTFTGKVVFPSTLTNVTDVFINSGFDNATFVFYGEPKNLVLNNILNNYWGSQGGTVTVEVQKEYLEAYREMIGTISLGNTQIIDIIPIRNKSVSPNEPCSGTNPAHVHKFEWQVITEPTKDTDGLEGEMCSCGATRNTQKLSAYGYALNEYATPLINKAVAGQTVTFEFGEWNSFPKSFMEKIAAKSMEGVTFVFRYKWNHEKQEITIPFGTAVDTQFEWYGPAKMAELYGMN